MRILFAALHFGSFRNYEPAIVRLAAAGHEVHLSADIHDSTGGQALVERLAASYPNVTWSFAPSLGRWGWTRVTRQARHGLECLRFSDPAYDAMPKYRHRSEVRAPRIVRALAPRRPARSALGALLRAAERGIPAPPVLVGWMREQRPDVVLLASVTNDGASQMDHLKAAQTLGLRVSLPIYSWDHLSGKAVLHIAPGQVLVWNETQRREAIDMHGLPADRVVVTGAYGYEQWFDRAPAQSRDEFCRERWLDPDRPIVLYVCSVLSRPAPPEAPFVLEWVRALRASADERLRTAGVIIRPHPERLSEWDAVDLSGLGAVVIRGRNPIDPHAKADYFDSLYHSSAVVGIITSAFIEAAVVGRPSLTIEDPRFREHHEGAPHYHYLRSADAGLLLVAPDLQAHVCELRRLLDGDPAAVARTRQFIDTFVRPPGGARSASASFAAAVESFGTAPAPVPAPFGRGMGALAAWTLRTVDAVPGLQRWLWNRQDEMVGRRAVEEREEKVAITTARRERQEQEGRERAERERLKAVRVRERKQRLAEREAERVRVKRSRQRARRTAQLKTDLKRTFASVEHEVTVIAPRRARSAWARVKGGIKHVLGLES